MALVRNNPNNGPFTLSHDPTPRSFSQDPVYKPAPNLYEGNFRFKGFPDHAFSRPTIPRTIPGDDPVISPPPQQPQQKVESPPPPPVSQRAIEPTAEKPAFTQQQTSPPSSPKKMMDQSPPSRGSWRSRGNQQMEQQGYVPSVMEGDRMPDKRQPAWQSQSNHNGYNDRDNENLQLGTNDPYSQVEQQHYLHGPATEYNNNEHSGTMGPCCICETQIGPIDGLPEEHQDHMAVSSPPWQRQQWPYSNSDNKPDYELSGTYEPFSQRDDPLIIEDYNGPTKQPASYQDSRIPHFPEHSYRPQYQGNPRFQDSGIASDSPRPIPIRNAHQKTDEEIRKIEQNYIEIDREKKRLKEEQRQKDMEKFAEQKKDFEMLKSYDPWGKPGAGAPRDDDRRKQKFTEEQWGEQMNSPPGQRPPDRFIRESFNNKPKEEKEKYYNDLREQDWQKKQMAEKNRNSDMGREMGSNGMQTPPMGRHETRKLMEQRERLSELQSEVNELKGGRDSDDEDEIYPKGMKLYPRRKVYNTWDKYEMARTQTRDSFHRRRDPAFGDSTYRSSYDKSPRNDSYDPWGKGLGNPEWDPEGNITRHEHKLGKTVKNLPPNYGAHYGNFPAPDRFGRDENYPSVKFDPFDNLGRSGKALRPDYKPVSIYFPYGKGGAGAPRGDGNYRNTGTMNKEFDEMQREKKRQKQRDYNSDLSMQIAEQDRNREAMRSHLKEPQSDMAVLMYEKQVGKPRRDQYGNIATHHHLGNSDVTRSKMNRPEMDTAMQRKYHDDLKRHAWDNQAQRNLDNLKDKQGDRRHQVTFNELWGRPGNGAPKDDTRKQKLDVTIHHPTTSFSMTDEYIRSKDWSQIGDENSPRFASYDESSPKIYPRSTVRSTHHNQYDYPWQVLQKKEYKVGAPYALH